MFLLYSPLNQGLKLKACDNSGYFIAVFLLYSPLNQGLKHRKHYMCFDVLHVFTLQSIKSRIETLRGPRHRHHLSEFLLYSPLNQGLKPPLTRLTLKVSPEFLLYSPLNQGLKRARDKSVATI